MKNDNIPPSIRDKRYAAFKGLLDDVGADALLVSDLRNIRYLCGFSGSAAAMFLTKDRSILLTDFRYETQAVRESVGVDIIIYKELLASLKELAGSMSVGSIAFEAKVTSYDQWDRMRAELGGNVLLIPLKEETARIRAVKDEAEIGIIKKAAEIAERAFASVIERIRPGAKESDIAIALEYEMKKMGAEKASFDIIVASGPNSALPHARPGDRKIRDGDFVVLDFGVVYTGYCTDETCTIKAGGVGDRGEDIYRIVQEAHDRAINAVKPGVSARYVDGIARGYIAEKGYGELFGHGTGHGVGLDVHELPVISERGDATLTEGMVFTIEPGIYVPELGGVRIEDMVCVTSHGAEVLTRCNALLRG